MADFQEQVMGITGLTIDGSSTDPSRSEFSTFLNDGVIDVTSKSILINPKTKDDFSRVSAEQTSNGFNPGTNKIISVIREAGVANDWRDCKKISFGLQSKVIDVDSLYYASQYNPAYMVSHNRTIDVFPEPNSGGVNGFKVLYVNSSPEETDGTALDHASTGIKWFPNDKVYLVIIYAAIKSLEAKMAEYTIDEEDTELVQTIAVNLASLKQQYEGFFAKGQVQQPQQQPQSR